MNRILALFVVILLSAFSGDGRSSTQTNSSKLELLSQFSLYKPNYIITKIDGNDYTNVEFQFSRKFKLIPNKYESKLSYGWFNTYFHYTQKSFWNTSEKSIPFGESNYSPGIFLDFAENLLPPYTKNRSKSFYLGELGWQHTSNGATSTTSRSLHIYYIEPKFVFGEDDDYTFKIKYKQPVGLSENPDFFDYIGRFEFNFLYKTKKESLGKTKKESPLSSLLSLTFDKSKAGNVNTRVRLRVNMFNQLNTDIFIQLWYGYGESLNNYNKHTKSIGIGIAF